MKTGVITVAAFVSACLLAPRLTTGQIEAVPRPLTPGELLIDGKTPPLFVLDRDVYFADDADALGYLLLPRLEHEAGYAGHHVRLRLMRGDALVRGVDIGELAGRKLHTRLNVASLDAGRYTLEAALVDPQGAVVGESLRASFERTADRYPQPGNIDVPLLMPEQQHVPGAAWPARAGVPLPRLAVRDVSELCVLEAGQPIPAEITPLATWGIDGSIRWAHVHWLARYENGQPRQYRLVRRPAPGAEPIVVTTTAGRVTVDTGVVRFEVNATKFAGLEKLWCDPTGQRRYDDERLAIDGSDGGPYVVDDKLIRYSIADDPGATVEVESVSPTRVVLLVRGDYVNPSGRTASPLRYKARITAYAGSPLIRLAQYNTILYDTFSTRLVDLGFGIATPNDGTLALGLDGQPLRVARPEKSRLDSFVHQDRHDHARVVGFGEQVTEGGILDGWFVPGGPAGRPRLALLVRDFREKFPHEVGLTNTGMAFHVWPKHGRRAYSLEEELTREHIYKFRCFHQGRLLDLHLPGDYVEKWLEYQAGARESRGETAATSSGQGMVIASEFAILPLPPDTDDAAIAGWNDLFRADPLGRAPRSWNAASGAMGPMAPPDTAGPFAPAEEAFEASMLAWGRRMWIGEDFGKFIWGNTHSKFHIDRNAADLHRVWMNSHYHHVSMAWHLFFRGQNDQMLRQARAFTDNFVNTGTVHYGEREPNPHRPGAMRSKIKYHVAGAMYHCKAVLPWGVEDYGVGPQDSHAGVCGHWIDPDAFLWAWFMDADPHARDTYALWADALNLEAMPRSGTKREINTTLAYAVTLYEHTHNPDLLPGIRGMAASLREVPLDKQTPGPLWHPLWINRYVDLTRDPQYTQFIIDNVKGRSQIYDTWTTGVSALGYELTGDRAFLEPHLPRLGRIGWQYYRDPEDVFDWHGGGPGPLGNSWGEFGFGRLLSHLQTQRMQPNFAAGQSTYPLSSVHFAFARKATPTVVFGLSTSSDQPLRVRGSIRSLYGTLSGVSLRVLDPQNKEVFRSHNETHPDDRYPGDGGSRIIADDVLVSNTIPGVYRYEFRGSAQIDTGITGLPHEVGLIDPDTNMFGTIFGVYLSPLDPPARVTFRAANFVMTYAKSPSYIRLSDASGAVIAEASMFVIRARKDISAEIDPAQHPFPWRLDGAGPAHVSFAFEGRPWMMARSLEDLDTMRPHVERALQTPVPAP